MALRGQKRFSSWSPLRGPLPRPTWTDPITTLQRFSPWSPCGPLRALRGPSKRCPSPALPLPFPALPGQKESPSPRPSPALPPPFPRPLPLPFPALPPPPPPFPALPPPFPRPSPALPPPFPRPSPPFPRPSRTDQIMTLQIPVQTTPVQTTPKSHPIQRQIGCKSDTDRYENSPSLCIHSLTLRNYSVIFTVRPFQNASRTVA